jgi:prepilin peptidase CpaA
MPIFPGTTLGRVAGAVYTLLLVYAAVGDLRSRRIPNNLVLVLGVAGLAFSVLHAPPLEGAMRGVGGLITALVVWLPFYMMGWVGAGDVKLFAASGAWLGPARTLEAAAISAVTGALLALVWMLWNHGLKRVVETVWLATAAPAVLASSADSGRSSRSLPYGVALVVGSLVAAWVPEILPNI